MLHELQDEGGMQEPDIADRASRKPKSRLNCARATASAN